MSRRETVKTLLFCAVALGLAVAAATVEPENFTPAILSDQGEPLFPRFTDPLAAKALEVVEYDESTATARPFKVEFKHGKWVIPSHYNYPADARDRLAKTAASLVDLKKDIVRSDLMEDHARYGVIDPLDQKVASLTGRGKRVTLRDAQGAVLADLILGQAVKEKPGYRYVRLPGQKRTYAVKTDADPSAKFEDWIETDLLKIAAAGIRKITIHNYSINETAGRVENSETTVLLRDKDKWTIAGAEKLNTAAVNALIATLDHLKIAGVLPKPPNLTESLRSGRGIQISMESMLSLRQRGFFITPDGRLLSKEGDLQVETADGLTYVLRFGEVVSGASEARQAKSQSSGEDRYLFVTVSYDAAKEAAYARAGAAPGSGEKIARDLSSRFAGWYYIISGADASKLRLKRKDLVRSY
jgi:hypothetical protein